MLHSVAAAMFSLLSLSSALPRSESFKAGEVTFGPSAAYQIFESSRDASVNLDSNFIPPSNPTVPTPPLLPPANPPILPPSNSTPNATITPRSNLSINSTGPLQHRDLTAQKISFIFHVSQGPNNTNQEDLVVSFADLPCPLASRVEFNFDPNAQYSSSGEGQIDMFKINGPLPTRPTYNNIQNITGTLIGSFRLPTGSEAESPSLIFINQLVCEPTINLRFGLSQYSSEAGAVAYSNSEGMGLMERSGK